jgi:4-amino-4-deoxy-L-arabinose transferase-like glycosyltransferase
MRSALRLARAFLAALALLLLTHYPILRLPFYWDELGQFVPAALDIFHSWAWVPYTTVPNVHPPGLMLYLALFWKMAGYSVLNTRFAMLILAACALVAQWKLARTLSGNSGPAWLATLFLFCSPLFFAQAPMAQLDMPAMLLTTVALTLFLESRFTFAALVCCAAVMTKETAVIAPALFGFVLLERRQVKAALLFTLPLVPLCCWLVVLRQSTGHLFGSPEFTDYNLFYPLHPVRLGLALFRRIYYLFIGSGHVIGTAAFVFWVRRRTNAVSDPWRIAGAFVGLHVIAISVLGGAVLERYLLPALPVLYAGFGMAFWVLKPKLRRFGALALAACLLVACVFNPPYPFPMENNLAWTIFVRLQKEASAYVSAAYPDKVIATTFPYAGGLRRPELGYVQKPLHVLEVNDFRESNLAGPVQNKANILVLYSVMWDPQGLTGQPWVRDILTRFYGFVPQVSPSDAPRLTGMRPVFRLCGEGQCVDVFSKGD